jgi:hypothetical protein
MDNGGTNYGRESGTGQDTPKVCVHVPPRFPLRLAGHSVTMSRPVPLSRIWGSPLVPPGVALTGWLRCWYCAVHRSQGCAP